MEIQFEPTVQAKLEQLAQESGRSATDLVQDAVVAYIEIYFQRQTAHNG